MTPQQDRSVASVRVLDIVVALALLAAGGLVIWDSVRVGISWVEDGPQAGYFPFYVGCLLCGSSLWTLGTAALSRAEARSFVSAAALKSILSMLLPTLVYVGVLAWLGLYVASFLYIAFFMIWLGKYSWPRSLAVAAGVSVIAFLLFETWFGVPLPKGPVEGWLGLL